MRVGILRVQGHPGSHYGSRVHSKPADRDPGSTHPGLAGKLAAPATEASTRFALEPVFYRLTAPWRWRIFGRKEFGDRRRSLWTRWRTWLPTIGQGFQPKHLHCMQSLIGSELGVDPFTQLALRRAVSPHSTRRFGVAVKLT
jgi:hypothetical protein